MHTLLRITTVLNQELFFYQPDLLILVISAILRAMCFPGHRERYSQLLGLGELSITGKSISGLQRGGNLKRPENFLTLLFIVYVPLVMLAGAGKTKQHSLLSLNINNVS